MGASVVQARSQKGHALAAIWAVTASADCRMRSPPPLRVCLPRNLPGELIVILEPRRAKVIVYDYIEYVVVRVVAEQRAFQMKSSCEPSQPPGSMLRPGGHRGGCFGVCQAHQAAGRERWQRLSPRPGYRRTSIRRLHRDGTAIARNHPDASPQPATLPGAHSVISDHGRRFEGCRGSAGTLDGCALRTRGGRASL